ncbi:MAG: PEP-CTERM sorting domain-containing protein [Acidobacteriia bacterium]|nr:PEP-CTERM sorting domain-containing protein [Terriglobia bacterium]
MNRMLKLLTEASTALVVLLLARVASADIIIDNFSCSDTVSLSGPAGATAFNASFISCPGSIGGNREDFIANLTGNGASGGSAGSLSTVITNLPANAVVGTFGSGIIGFEGMQWGVIGGQPNVFDLNLNLVGDSILVQLQSSSAGSLLAIFGQNALNFSTFSTTFSGGPSYQDVLLPLIDPTVTGTGWNLADATQILLDVQLDTPGAFWSIDEAKIVTTPEPSTLPLMSTALLVVVIISSRRRPRPLSRRVRIKFSLQSTCTGKAAVGRVL